MEKHSERVALLLLLVLSSVGQLEAQPTCTLPDPLQCATAAQPEAWRDVRYYTTGEPLFLDVLANDRHPTGLPLTLVAFEGVPTGVTVTAQADQVLTAVVNLVGELVTFQYKVSDGNPGHDTTASVILIPIERKGAPVVGCYFSSHDGCLNDYFDQPDPNSGGGFDYIEAAGFDRVDVGSLAQATEVWKYDVLIVNHLGSQVHQNWQAARQEVYDWVAAGGVLAVHGSPWIAVDHILPGTMDQGDVGPVQGNDPDVAAPLLAGVTSGNLDDAFFTYNDYLLPAGIPSNSVSILTMGSQDGGPGIVAFAYPYGEGWVYYSSVDLNGFQASWTPDYRWLDTEQRRLIVELYGPSMVSYVVGLRPSP